MSLLPRQNGATVQISRDRLRPPADQHHRGRRAGRILESLEHGLLICTLRATAFADVDHPGNKIRKSTEVFSKLKRPLFRSPKMLGIGPFAGGKTSDT